MQRLRGKLSYSNVMATIAVFIALGGASYAAVRLPKNSVGSKQIKNNAITSAKIKNGAVTGSKIAVSSLGTVPSATTATTATTAATATKATTATTAQSATSAQTAANSQTLQGMTPAQIAALADLTCPSGTRSVAGVCFETTPRTSATFVNAERTCAKAGRRLPDQGELAAYDYVTDDATEEWVADLGISSSEFVGFATAVTETNLAVGVGNLFVSQISEPYRCAVAPSN